MKLNFNDYDFYKQVEKDDWMYNYYVDDDGYEWVIVTDENDNIMLEEETGNCGCSSCREGN